MVYICRIENKNFLSINHSEEVCLAPKRVEEYICDDNGSNTCQLLRVFCWNYTRNTNLVNAESLVKKSSLRMC